MFNDEASSDRFPVTAPRISLLGHSEFVIELASHVTFSQANKFTAQRFVNVFYLSTPVPTIVLVYYVPLLCSALPLYRHYFLRFLSRLILPSPLYKFARLLLCPAYTVLLYNYSV